MKKFILFISLSLVATLSSAQVIFYVEAPSANEGNYGFTFANDASWGSPDLTDPLNSVTGVLCMADDGTAADSLACVDAVNAAVSGKVAVLYRGDCEFGVKALHCQNAGAIAVIIVNNLPGAPVGMNGGAQGTNVTIPVIMISDVDGATLKAEAETCAGTTVFLGSKTGFYGNDLGCYPQHILRAEQFGNIQELSQDASEFSIDLGSWVINYGSNNAENVTLQAVIDNGSVVYDQTSAPEALILPGDSVFMALPLYSEATYANGYYDVTYTIASDSVDEFLDDNIREADFMMSDSLYSYSRIDAGTFKPVSVANYRSSTAVSSNSSCLSFVDPNASRIGIAGMTFSAVTTQNPTPTSIDGEFVQVFAYEWDDAFVDLNDVNFGITLLNEVASGDYIYTSDAQNAHVYVPFSTPVALDDDQRYLFCMTHYGDKIFSGYDTEYDYNWNLETYLQPQFPGESDGSWFATGFGTEIIPALTVNMVLSAGLGVEEEKDASNLIAYPNPANALVNIPVGENYGAIALTIMDMSGKIVSTQNIEMNSGILTVDVSTLASGSYVFNILHGDVNEVMTVNIAR